MAPAMWSAAARLGLRHGGEAVLQTFDRAVSVMAQLAAVGDWRQFEHTLTRGLRTILFVTVPSAVGLVALREPIVRLLFEVGEFGPEDTTATAYGLLFFAIGVFAVSSVQVLTRAYYSMQDTITPVKIGAIAVLTNGGLSLILLRTTNLGHGGLALAFSVAAVLQMTLQFALLRRKLDGRLPWSAIAGTFGKSLAAAVVMFPVASFAGEWIGQRVDLALLSGRLIQV